MSHLGTGQQATSALNQAAQAAVHAAVHAAVQAADLDKCFPEAEKQPPHLRLVRGDN